MASFYCQGRSSVSARRKGMKEKELYSKKWNDLLFEHRNKDYGAYRLRAEAGRRYACALTVLLILVALAFAPLVVMMCLERPRKVNLSNPISKITRFEGIRIQEARPLRRPPQASTPQLAEKEELAVLPVEQKEGMATEQDKEILKADLSRIEDISADSLEKLQKEAILNIAKGEQRTSGVIIDSIPRYPTGIAGFMKWLDKYMVYPKECLRRKESGRVVVAFVVETDGSVSNLHIVKGDIRELNHEVLRVLRMMPKWIPGQRNGHPIRSQVTLPVEFEFDDQPFS